MVTVRAAVGADREVLVRMAVRFITETNYRRLLTTNEAQLRKLVDYLLEHGTVFVAAIADDLGTEHLVGMLGVAVLINPVSGELVGSECAWWVEPEYRGGWTAIRMLAAAESWARERGALRFQMLAPVGADALRGLYDRRGYAEVETVFQRSL